ncbi:hypothetical protein [Snodgrassella sp. ESL0253]|nr:hypothetical protein [Snodgrassella sp. ESL0253]NUE66342.1 hypothetical protein [Snodgrassella sp. ESL0253]
MIAFLYANSKSNCQQVQPDIDAYLKQPQEESGSGEQHQPQAEESC